jgi:cytochrome b
MNRAKGKVFVWPICSRIIHWTIAISFTLAFVTSYYEHLLNYHAALGYLFMTMLLFRILWGFIGPRYATFNTFKLKPKDLVWYFVEKVKDRWRKIPPGHNPASSWYTILVLFIGTMINISGIALYGAQEGRGLLSFLNETYYIYMDPLFEVHMILAYFLGIWAIIHIVGVLIEQFYHKTSMVFVMITGYKKSEGEDTDLCPLKNFFAFSVIFGAAGGFYYGIHDTSNYLVSSRIDPVDYSAQNALFYDNCSKCHKIYPPFMLPQRSWNRLMDGISNHFGEEITEANITKPDQDSIREYLLTNAADLSTQELSYKLMCSLKEDERPKSITKTSYWREVHSGIDPKAFKSKQIKDKSNCFACHEDFEKGIADDIKITYHQ